MKKIVLSLMLILTLAAGAFIGSLPAEAASVPVPTNPTWDMLDNYGTAKWDSAGENANYYIQLYMQNPLNGDFLPKGSPINVGRYTQFSLIKEIRAGGEGVYTFTVRAVIDGVSSDFTKLDPVNLSLDFKKLETPINADWDWSTNEIVRAKWTGVAGAENYKVQITKKASESASTSQNVALIDSGSNTSAAVFDVLRKSGQGYYTFTVRATSSRAADSEWSLPSASLKYPIKLPAAENVRWGHIDGAGEYGIARWDIVPNATAYSVQFYQVLPYIVDILGDDGKPLKDPQTGENLKKTEYYYYETMGKPIDLAGSVTDPPSNYCKVDNLVKGSGIYFFTVQARGDQSFENSDTSKPFKDSFTPPTPNSNGHLEIGKTEQEATDKIKPNVFFKYIAPTKISIDFDNNGIPDEDQSKVLFMAIGQKKTINVLVEPANATNTGFIWSNSTNSAAFDQFTPNGSQITMSTINKGKLVITVTPVLSGISKTISITSSEPPTKLIISGKNSYTTNDTGELYLQVIPETAYVTPEYIDWTSSNSNVATVNGGKVTTTKALGAGKTIDYATITAKSKLDDRIQGTYRIAVSNTQILPSRIVISGNNTVAMKSKLQLKANVYAGEEGNENEGFAYNKDVTWTTSNDKVATVDANGLVTPKAVGKALITATSKADGSSNIKGSIEINVVPEEINITKIALSGPTTVKVGETITIKAAITPANATDRTLVWTCSGNGQLDFSDELVRTFTGTYEGESLITVYAQNAPSIKTTFKVKVTTASDKPSTEQGETQVIINVKPTPGVGDKKNEYTAVVKPEVLNEAIDKAFSEASRLKTTPVITIKVETPAAAVDLITKLPYSCVGRIANYYGYYGYSSYAILEIQSGIASVRLYSPALKQIYNQANYNSDIQTKFSRVVTTDLNEAQRQAIGKRPVIGISISSAGRDITSFGNNSITISLPFSLTSAQSGKGAQVDNLTDYGQLIPMGCKYNYKTKSVYFDTYHLSYFSPHYYASIAWDNPFTDVRITDWFYDSVFYVVDRELMRGVSADRFVPGSYTTRGMVVTILHRLAGTPAPTKANTFTDVKSDQWYTDAVLWATEENLVNGYGGGRFGPEDKVTREQLAVMLHNYAKYVDITPQYGWDTPMRYPDLKNISSWARQGAMYCQITGIITGRPNGNFEPKDTASRAELATMLLRMNDQMEKQLASKT